MKCSNVQINKYGGSLEATYTIQLMDIKIRNFFSADVHWTCIKSVKRKKLFIVYDTSTSRIANNTIDMQ